MFFISSNYTNEDRKKKIIDNKGVSLISLIVIIIVLLILAAVAIKISSGDSGLIKKTKKGVAIYQNASVNESETLNEYAGKLKAFVEGPKATSIKFTADIVGWTTKDVTITATSDDPDYEIELKSEDSDWSVRKDNKITVSKNQQINARLKKNADQYSEDVATYNVTNIDKDAPDKAAPALKATTNSITATFKQKDDGSGIAKREYSIDNGATWKVGDSVFTFSGLTQGKKYEIITRATDRVENQSISDVSYITTGTIPAPVVGSNLTFTPSTSSWTNSNVSVAVSTTIKGCTLQTSTDGKSWGTTNPLTYTANGTAYARLWDGNNASAVATTNITNIDKLAPTISISGEAGNTSVKINATTSDSQSGVNSSSLKYKIDNGTWQTSNVFDNLDPDKTYTFVAQVTDNAGNSTESNKISLKPLGGVFVKLYDTDSDGTGDTLTFGNNPNYTYNGTLKTDYGNQKNISNNPPWINNESIKKADFVTTVKPKYTSMWFSGLTKLESINTIENLDTREVTNMYEMFYNCSSLTSLDVSNFDTSKVTKMSYMFYNCEGLTSLDLSNFDTSNVKGMAGMFDGCQGLTSLDLSNFDTSKVTHMTYMFYNCEGLTSLDLSNFNTSNVIYMGYMFYNCEGLTSLNVSNFNTSEVTDMYEMFYNCSSLTSLDLSNFNTSNVTSMDGMFHGCQGLTSLDLSNFDTSNVTNMIFTFYDCKGLTSLNVSNFDTSNVTDMYYMFCNCSSLTSLDVSNFNTSKVTNMTSMFANCSSLTSLDVSNFDTSNVTDMFYMFSGCQGLTSLNVSNFDTSKVTDMGYMFDGCQGLTSLDVSNFDTSNVTNMGYMFYLCEKLTSLDVSNFDTSNVTNMGRMFHYCPGLTSLDVSNFDTSNVTNMENMFYLCTKLTSLDVSNFNTSKVTNMHYMFDNCSSLTSLDLSNFNTSNVTDMYGMFSFCQSLTSLDLSNFDTSNVTNMRYMFANCSSLTSLDLSNFDTSNVTNIAQMFSYCQSLTTIYVDNTKWSTTNVTYSDGMFNNCTKLKGQNGTVYSSSHVDASYAKVDGGTSNPGYLTDTAKMIFGPDEPEDLY